MRVFFRYKTYAKANYKKILTDFHSQDFMKKSGDGVVPADVRNDSDVNNSHIPWIHYAEVPIAETTIQLTADEYNACGG